MDVAEFLAARLDETEADNLHYDWCDSVGAIPFPCDCGYPAQVRRDVAAKRAILAQHESRKFQRYGGIEVCCKTCVTDHEAYMDDDNPDPWPCATVRALASEFSDSPDYDPAWGHQAEYKTDVS